MPRTAVAPRNWSGETATMRLKSPRAKFSLCTATAPPGALMLRYWAMFVTLIFVMLVVFVTLVTLFTTVVRFA